MSAPSSPTRPSQGSPSQRSPGKTSPLRSSRENSAAPPSPPKSPPKPGVVGPREWEKSLTVKCRLCGGPKCRRCSESAALAKPTSPVTGLHADWATDSMLGMMRPSSRLFQAYRIVEQFQRLKIKAVFNLTLPGEHPYCGDGLMASGFPYDPETDLMAHNIQCYNFGWEDMTTPTLAFMVDLVKVMTGVLSCANQKLAVHCHAGFGRTGLAIACALVFQHDISPQNATDIVRRGRPGSIQTPGQVEFIRLFYDYTHGSKLVYAMPSIHDRFTLHEMAEREGRQYIHSLRSTLGIAPPRVVSFLCKSLEAAAAAASPNAQSLCMIYVTHLPATSDGSMASHFEHMKGLLGTDSDVPPLGQAMVVAADELWPHKVKMNTGEFSDIPPECVGGLLLDWLEHLQVPIVQHPKVVLATGAAFNALPLLTLRTLECIFNLTRTLLTKLLSEHTHATASTTATICDAVVGRTTMACLQLSAGAAKPYFSKVRHLLDTWTCPKPLPLNDGRIAELNLAPVDAAGRFDSPMDRGAVGHGSYSSTSLHDGETSKWDQNPHQPLSPAHASSAPHVGDSSGLPPVKPPSPAHPPPPSGAFSSSFVAANTIKNTDDAGENHVTLDGMSKSTSPVLGDTELTPSTNSSASLHSVGESKLLSPLHQSSSSPTKECSMEPPLLLSVKGSVPRSLPALHIPRKQSAAQ